MSPDDTPKSTVLTVNSNNLHTQQSQLDRPMSTTMCRACKLSPDNVCESTIHTQKSPLIKQKSLLYNEKAEKRKRDDCCSFTLNPANMQPFKYA